MKSKYLSSKKSKFKRHNVKWPVCIYMILDLEI